MSFPFLRKKKKDAATGEGGARNAFPTGIDDAIFREHVKVLRAKILHKAAASGRKVFAVTSAIAGEGKTVFVQSLAACLSGAGERKALVVDADLRKSDLAKRMGIPASPGLGEYLSGTAAFRDVLRPTQIEGLYVITAGAINHNPSELLAGERFLDFGKVVRNDFDVILVDAPPILPVADALSIGNVADGLLIVFRAGHTPYTMLQQALEEVGEEKIVGVVINGVTPKSDRYYRSYYGSYYTK